jgi:GntR family transcriptional regulator
LQIHQKAAGNSGSEKAIPRYFLVQSSVLNRIEKGEWAPGDMIPTEKELSSAFGVSIGTVKTALLNLVNTGLLFRVQGKGTFVSGSMIGRDKIRLYHFVSDFENQHAPLKVRFQNIKQAKGPQPACRYLKIKPGMELFQIDRIFTLKNKPVVFAVSFLPQSLFRDIDKFPREIFESKPLYQLFEDAYKLPTVRYQEMFAVTQATREMSSNLGVPETFPLLQVEMLALTFKNRPLEYRISYCHTDTVKLFRMPMKMMPLR